MKISKIDIFVLKNALREKPFPVKPVCIRVKTDNDLFGFGEAGISAGFGSLAVAHLLKELCPLLIGKDPFDYEKIDKEYRSMIHGHISGGGVIFYSALAAINMALLDICSQYKNVPLYELLGEKKRGFVDVYASQVQDGYKEVNKVVNKDDYIRAINILKKDGIKAAKFNFHSFDLEGKQYSLEDSKSYNKELIQVVEDRVKTLREIVGDDFMIISESLNKLSFENAKEIDEIFTKYHVAYAEEYFYPDEYTSYIKAAETFLTPMACGEKQHSLFEFMPYFVKRIIKVAQPDPSICGINETIKISKEAQKYDIAIQPHLCGTSIAVAACLHIEAVIENFIVHEHINQLNIAEVKAYTTNNFDVEDGRIKIPNIAGLGTALSEEAIQQAIEHFVVE